MAAAAVAALGEHGSEPSGGVIVGPEELASPHPAIRAMVGDHPIPGARSFSAASSLAGLTARVHGDDEVWVLLSGGATSLVAAPESNIRPGDLVELYDMLLGSGLDITLMNAVRKRFSRWAAGRLAVALEPAKVRCFVISDVISNDLSAIGSGPCVPDEFFAADVRSLLEETGLWDRTPAGLRRYVMAVEKDRSLETPKPGNPVFWNLEKRVIASNQMAVDAIAASSRALGFDTVVMGTPLEGEATAVGKRIAGTLLSQVQSANPEALTLRKCLVWGGETTVTLVSPHGLGGRCQQLALSAAHELPPRSDEAGRVRISLLAAGTDGRDGPTDAAGAIVDRFTWGSIRQHGRDPLLDLASFSAYPALDSVGALIRTGLTGTNVMDVAIGICGSSAA